MKALIANREDTKKAIDRKGPSQIPTCQCLWWGEGLQEQYGNSLKDLEAEYPDDVFTIRIPIPPWADTPYSWRKEDSPSQTALDAGVSCLIGRISMIQY